MILKTLAIASLLLVTSVATAGHGGAFTDARSITVDSPANYAPIVFPCDVTSPFNGLSGYWYDLASNGMAGAGHSFLLSSDDPLDIDPYFYDVNCDFISNGGAAMGGIGVAETGTVPPNAAFLLVWGALGHGTYELTLAD